RPATASFAFAAGDAAGAVEGVEEIGAKVFVGEIDGPSGAGDVAEAGFAARGLVEGIEEHFRNHPAGVEAGEVLPVVFIRFAWLRGKLIDLATDDRADDVLDVELVIEKILGQS